MNRRETGAWIGHKAAGGETQASPGRGGGRQGAADTLRPSSPQRQGHPGCAGAGRGCPKITSSNPYVSPMRSSVTVPILHCGQRPQVEVCPGLEREQAAEQGFILRLLAVVP